MSEEAAKLWKPGSRGAEDGRVGIGVGERRERVNGTWRRSGKAMSVRSAWKAIIANTSKG